MEAAPPDQRSKPDIRLIPRKNDFSRVPNGPALRGSGGIGDPTFAHAGVFLTAASDISRPPYPAATALWSAAESSPLPGASERCCCASCPCEAKSNNPASPSEVSGTVGCLRFSRGVAGAAVGLLFLRRDSCRLLAFRRARSSPLAIRLSRSCVRQANTTGKVSLCK